MRTAVVRTGLQSDLSAHPRHGVTRMPAVNVTACKLDPPFLDPKGDSSHPVLRGAVIALLIIAPFAASYAQTSDRSGNASFTDNCVICHAGDGRGTNRGPSILEFVASASGNDVGGFLRSGSPERGMPAFDLPDSEMEALVEFLRTLPQPSDSAPALPPADFPLADGGHVRGVILNQSGFDAQVRTATGSIRLLRRSADTYSEAEIGPSVDWPTYHGTFSGNRHSPLDQINRGNVRALAPQWFYPIPGQRMIEGTPVVIDGIMYVTAVNRVTALDAETGREIWTYSQPRNTGLVGDAAIGLNRGVAVRDDLVFTVTDHAHAIALDRSTGELVWDVEMADWRDHYGAIAAPLAIGDLVYFGISGGDTGLRGFLDAYLGRDRGASLAVLDDSGTRRARFRDMGGSRCDGEGMRSNLAYWKL